MVSEYLGKANEATGAVKDITAGVQRKPFDYSAVKTDFTNGESLDSPDGSTTKQVSAKAGGSNSSSSAGIIELIHFGTVYQDSQRKFHHQELDDYKTIDMSSQVGGRAIAHRAALERELMLLCGYMRSIQSAMKDAGKAPPVPDEPDGLQMLNQMIGFMGDMFGGAGAGQVQASTVDLNPLIDEATAIAGKLDVADIKYDELHDAGIKLHELRCKYSSFLQSQHGLLPKDGADKGLMSGLPFIGDALPGEIGVVFEWAQKLTTLSLGFASRLTLEMHMKLEESVNMAVRDIGIASIRNRFAPIYSVWFEPPPPEDDGNDDDPDSGTGIGFLDDAVNEVEGAVESAEGKAKDLQNLLNVPVETRPGTPFLEQAFMLKAQGTLVDRSEALSALAGQAILNALNEEWMPPIIADISGYLFRLVTEFVRAVYGKLVILGRDAVPEAALLEAGRAHLVDAIIELPFTYLSFLQDIRRSAFANISLPLPSGDTFDLNLDGLINKLKQVLTEQLAFMDPAVAYAMKDFHGQLMDARASAGDTGLTMEAYLALMPALHARMFKNLLLPFWTAMMNAIKSGLASALAPVMGAIGGPLGGGGFMGDAYNALDKAQQGMNRVQEGLALLENASFSTGEEDPLKKITDLGRDFTDPADPFGAQAAGTVPKPFSARKTTGKAAAIKDADLEKVVPNHKWNSAPPDSGATGETSKEQPAS